MKLKSVNESDIETMSYDDIAYVILKEKGSKMKLLDLFNEVCNQLHLNETEADKYIGDLSPIETLCYSLLKDEVDNFIITITNPFNDNQKIDIKVGDLSQLDTDIDLSNGNPIINVKCNLTAEVINSIESQDQSYDETLKILDVAIKDYLTDEFKSYLYKTSREYKSDINEFYRLAKRQFLTNSDFLNYDWATKYESADFNVEFNEDIISTLIIRQNE